MKELLDKGRNICVKEVRGSDNGEVDVYTLCRRMYPAGVHKEA